MSHHLGRKSKTRIILFFVLNALAYIQIAWKYPLAEVTPASDECKSKHRDHLTDKCKVKLPILTPSDYDNTQAHNQHGTIFTMLYGATYFNQRDYTSWGNPGIDIASAKGTPVYSIWDGVVIYADMSKWGGGNRVSIAHQDNGKTIYSHYSHLNTIEVSKNQKISAGTRIWTIGNSGRTIGKYGNHLDFQIDIKDSYSKMFGYYGCADWYVTAINKGACRPLMIEYTIDPLKFLADRNATLPTPQSVSYNSTPATQNIILNNTPTPWPQSNKNTNINESQTPQKSDSHPNLSLPLPQTHNFQTRINNLVYHVEGLYPKTIIGLKKKLTITIKLLDEQWKARQWVLPDTIDIISSNRNITSTIETINYIDGQFQVTFTGKKPGQTNLVIQAWDYNLANVTVLVQ
jgi:murein DD-endopeptidase MepM/ murein hydrolase activator NlpD